MIFPKLFGFHQNKHPKLGGGLYMMENQLIMAAKPP
jgi:hypothetical protein